MFAWLQKDIPVAASIFFRGNWPCTREGFAHLRGKGIELSDLPGDERTIWALRLEHPEWGDATLICMREFPMPPHALIEWDGDLIDSEKDEIKACGTAVSLMVNSRRKHLLRDRKCALLFAEAVMGEEGIATLDHLSERFWSRAALRTEVSHAADVDVQSLFTVHYVSANDEDGWLHTHGLASIGLIDFDILNPSESVAQPGSDAIRAIAQTSLEGHLKAGADIEIFGETGAIRAVSAAEFTERAAEKWRAMREQDENHSDDRVVLCDPPGKGLLGRWRGELRPSSILSHELPDDTMIHFSSEATELMSERARNTYSIFRAAAAELAELELPALVKIGYPIDSGSPDQREHLWFQVHDARDGEVDATLLNQPIHIARMNEGDRAVHSVAALSDWQIMTPVGPINPRQTLAWRHLREAIAKSKEEKSA